MEITTEGQEQPKSSITAAELEGRLILPETELTMTGAEFMTLVNAVRGHIHNNRQQVFGEDGKFVGQFVLPEAQFSLSLHNQLLMSIMNRFFEEGKTVDFDEYKKYEQTRAMEAETPQIITE